MKHFLRIYSLLLFFNYSGSAQPFVRDWYRTWGNDSVQANMNLVNMCADNFGNVYVHTQRDSVWSTTVSMITKYKSSGQRDWEQSYSNPFNQRAFTNQLKCDLNGNVFLGGYEVDANGNYTELLLKYDSLGNLLWKFNYPFPAGQSGSPTIFDLDSLNNAYLLTTVYFNDGVYFNEDMLLCKLNPLGNLVWSKFLSYPDTAGLHDNAGNLIVDRSNNVIIAGTTQDSIILAKFDSSGTLMWENRTPSYYPYYHIVVDDSNYVYTNQDVGGTSMLSKHDSLGTVLWQKNITQLYSCKINYLTYKHNYLYTTGDYGTFKLDLNGDTIWRRQYVTGPGTQDQFKKLVVENNGDITVSGNIYINPPVYGLDLGITKYDSMGVLKWHLRYNTLLSDYNSFRDFTKNAYGNFFSGSVLSAPYTFPQVLWIAPNGSNTSSDLHRNFQCNNDYSTKISKDYSGNLVVAGLTTTSNQNGAIGFLKYDNSGNLLWAKSLLASNSLNFITALKHDEQNNVYVSGARNSANNNYIASLLKLNPNGDTLFKRDVQRNASCSEIFSNFTFDRNKNIYILNDGIDSANAKYFEILKYDSSGTFIWNKFVSDSAISSGRIISDETDNIYYSYRKINSIGPQYDIVVSKMDTAGHDLWTTPYDNTNHGFDYISDMKLDHNKNIVLSCISNIYNWDLNVIKIDSLGQIQWNTVYSPYYLTITLEYALAIDESNNIYITGREDSTQTIANAITLKIKPDGVVDWINKIRAIGHLKRTKGSAIAYGDGFVYVTGSSYNLNDHTYMYLMVYDTLGAIAYFDSIAEPYHSAGDPQEGLQIIYDNGCAYMTGRVYTAAGEGEFSALKYCNTIVGISTPDKISNTLDVFPNPSNGTFQLRFNSRENQKARIEVYNLVGKIVSQKSVTLNQGLNLLLYDVNLSAGSYLVVLKTNNGEIKSGKLICTQ